MLSWHTEWQIPMSSACNRGQKSQWLRGCVIVVGQRSLRSDFVNCDSLRWVAPSTEWSAALALALRKHRLWRRSISSFLANVDVQFMHGSAVKMHMRRARSKDNLLCLCLCNTSLQALPALCSFHGILSADHPLTACHH